VFDRMTIHELDEADFPELEREPGVYGLEPFLLRPDTDSRIPAPKASQALLLVSFTLLSADVPWGSRWVLVAEGPEVDGKLRRNAWHLVPPPPKHENRQPLKPDTNPARTPGALDRGVFWIDLSAALREQKMRPGDTLTLRLAQAQAQLVLPLALRR